MMGKQSEIPTVRLAPKPPSASERLMTCVVHVGVMLCIVAVLALALACGAMWWAPFRAWF